MKRLELDDVMLIAVSVSLTIGYIMLAIVSYPIWRW